MNSLVHSEKEKKKERTGELSNIKRPGRPLRTTVVDDQRILSIEKAFHNIQPSEEHSPGGSVTVKVYNQEKTSREQIQRVHHKVQRRPD